MLQLVTLGKVSAPNRPTATNYVYFKLVGSGLQMPALLLLRCPQLHVHEQIRSRLSCNLSNVLTDLHLECTAGMLV